MVTAEDIRDFCDWGERCLVIFPNAVWDVSFVTAVSEDDVGGIGTPAVRLYDHDTDKFLLIPVIAFYGCRAIAGR